VHVLCGVWAGRTGVLRRMEEVSCDVEDNLHKGVWEHVLGV